MADLGFRIRGKADIGHGAVDIPGGSVFVCATEQAAWNALDKLVTCAFADFAVRRVRRLTLTLWVERVEVNDTGAALGSIEESP